MTAPPPAVARRARPLAWLDVFTATPLQGNGLAVVDDADGLDDATMLAFARETRLSETTFVQAATRAGATYRNRIWTPEYEMPFAGHPSLGTAVAVARWRGDRAAEYVQQTPAGVQAVTVELDAAGERARASVVQEPAEFGAIVDVDAVVGAAGLDAGVVRADVAPQVVSTGARHVICLVAHEATLASVRPDAAMLRALQDERGTSVLYVAWWDGAGRAVARSLFAEGQGWSEDPATGSAAGPLTALLHARFRVERLDVDQGVHMGRASRLACTVEGERVRVGGDAVLVAEGTLWL